MAKSLERDVGLYAVITISIGAMIGSGIFVLPGLASQIAGPAVVAAYLLAGLLVLPAALSKAEMATAMPESGGTYLYIDRAMGPLMGTVAGIGAWFSLVFKSAFALVGLGAYLVLFAGLPTKAVALVLAGLLTMVNVLGAKQTARLQAFIVSGVLAVLAYFVIMGAPAVQAAQFRPLLPEGASGLFAAAGFVFVSYAGVTKIASVAEEVKDPGRNIPIGILFSILLMMVVYTAIVLVVVGVTPADSLATTLTPMADAAGEFLGRPGVIVVAVTAVLALTSMANAGILSSSRYPFAMSRDQLAPGFLRHVSARFATPFPSILVTGLSIVLLIAFVDVVELAKLASAFQILVFSLENIALIAFREGEADWYEPSFRSPLYPWVQFIGIAGGVLLLTQMGVLPMAGALTIIVGGVLWYQFYARRRTVREGVGVDAIRRQAARTRVEATREELEQEGAYTVLVPVSPAITPERAAPLLRVATDVVRKRGGVVQVIRFEQVPEQVSLEVAVSERTPDDEMFEAQTRSLSQTLGMPVQVNEVVSHDTSAAVLAYVEREEVDLIVADAETPRRGPRLFGRGLVHLLQRAPCEVILVRSNAGMQQVRDVAVTSAGAPFDPEKVRIANALAEEAGGTVRLVHAVENEAPDSKLASIRAYHDELGELCTVPTKSIVLRDDDWLDAVVSVVDESDVVVVGASHRRLLGPGLRRGTASEIARRVRPTTLIVRPPLDTQRSLLTRIVERLLY